LGEKLGIEAESDLRILVLLWKIGATAKPGCLLKTEWMKAATTGVISVQPGSWKTLAETHLPTLDIGFLTGSEFKDFYEFCFLFNRQGTHRTLDRELTVALLRLVLKDRVAADRLQSFCEFLESTGTAAAAAVVDNTSAATVEISSTVELIKKQPLSPYDRITLDQWTSFWAFCVECEDLQAYDESTSAWPVLIDEYVEFMETKHKSNRSK
jgi:hypothetical protein